MHVAAFCAVLLMAAVAATGQTTRQRVVDCSSSSACFPWLSSGPFCGRGANINMRFQMDLTKGNYVTENGEVVSKVTYAYCPRVDELQAFNLTDIGALSLTIGNDTFPEFMDSNEIYLRAIGFGDTDDVNFPVAGSAGRVMIADALSRTVATSGSLSANQCQVDTEVAVATFLILNVSMKDGRFQYYDTQKQPGGVGFMPTCDDSDVCLLDSDLKCIGEAGMRNCAQCLTPEQARTTAAQVWVSYYGTDSSGRQLRSGASNPLNFRVFSGTAGIGTAMTRSYRNLDGRNNDDLEPE